MRGRLIYMCILILSLCGCRKELCYNHDEHSFGVRIDLRTDWELVWERDYGCGWEGCWNPEWGCGYEDLSPGIPEGIRLIAYHKTDGYKDFNIDPQGKRVTLGTEGEYSFLLYNNDTEYLVYSDLSSSKEASATTRTTSRAEFKSPNEGERVINQPDMLFGRYIETMLVERKMETEVVQLEMRPLVYTYFVRMEFSQGYEYLSKAQGLFAGMAEKVYLYDGHTGTESASIMFDCEEGEDFLSAKVMTFGVPDYPGDHYSKGEEDGKEDYMIRLDVLMTNGLYKTFDIDVSAQMKNQPRGGVILIEGLCITDEEGGVFEGGGFGVGVDPWGDTINIPLK
ncbi:MAG: DUF5119 domain-containing protein [Bacteroidales bacterium]|nr:DUF5119 domain-containing protein [Bacteroidales bacterium]